MERHSTRAPVRVSACAVRLIIFAARWFGRRSRGIPRALPVSRLASGGAACRCHASGNMPMRKSDVPCGTSSTSSA